MSQRNIDIDDSDTTRGPDLNPGLASRKRGNRKRISKFYQDKTFAVDYKDPQSLKYFITERGKIVPRRISGLTARDQRKVMLAIKRARHLALMPFTVTK